MSPTEALNNWKSINGLADTKNKYFFSENLRTKEEMNTSDVKNELIRVAELIVNKEFPINEDFFMQLLKKEKEETYYEKHFNAEKYFSNKKDMGVYRL
ncbi:MAG: hypothetical protein QM532_02600 [Cyanobium sp. MAG06]|nr:hypothetical protein [Cyanobium sp. MAG06]